MKRTPNIRFKGFDGEWEHSLLSKFLDVYDKKNKDDSLKAEDIMSVSGEFGVVNQIEFHGKSFAGASLKGYRVTNKGNVIYTKSPLKQEPYGIIKANKLETGIVSALYAVYSTKGNIDASFIQEYFKLDARLNSYLLPLINKGAKNTILVSDEEAIAGFVNIPDPQEQVSISKFLETLDTLISQRTKEVEKMRNIKRALLEKMFPQDGQSVPQIRFKEFTGDWEIMQLGNLADKITKKNSSREITETFTNSAEFGIISQRDFFDHNISNENNTDGYYVVENNDFVYNPRISALAPVGPINRNKLGRTGIMSPLYTVFRSHDIECAYLEWFFKGNTWHVFMKLNGNNGARLDRFSISDNVFWTMPIAKPHNEEQTKIAKLLQSLDTTISARDRQITLLKNLKLALLEQMFVNN